MTRTQNKDDPTDFEVGRAKSPQWEGKHMQKGIGWLSMVGFFGLLAAANAQISSSDRQHAI
jgi:hypothetical protein